jgi:hypothetical protein
MLRLARYVCLGIPPRSTFIPVKVDPTIPSVQVSWSDRCYWRRDADPCGGRYFHLEAYLARRRNVESEACEVHLNTVLDKIVMKLEEAAKAEQRRQAGRRRKRLARQRAREHLATATAPTT